jgi:hypothetical protein
MKSRSETEDYNDWSADYDKLMANLMFGKYQDVKST